MYAQREERPEERSLGSGLDGAAHLLCDLGRVSGSPSPQLLSEGVALEQEASRLNLQH